MTTSADGKRQYKRAFTPTEALAKSVEFDEEMMRVYLTDGRIISVPIVWFPILQRATPAQRKKVLVVAGGRGLRWEELDEDLSVAGFLAGADWQAA